MSDRAVFENKIPVYHPRNSYYYDNEENYEPDIIEEFLDYEEENSGRPWYTTTQIMGYEDSGVPNDFWYRLDEIPDSYISSRGMIWSFGLGRFRIPRKLYMNRPNHPYWVIYAKEGMFYLHRLLAKYFIPNPNHYPVVRHLDDDGLNYNLQNLAWGTQRDNVHDAMRNGTFRPVREEARLKGNAARRTRVIAKNADTGEEIEFPSTAKAAKACGVSQSLVSDYIRGKIKGKYSRSRKFTFRRASECP